MAKVYLACTASTDDHPFARRDFERLKNYAAFDKVKKHTITDNVKEAAIVAFIGSAKANFSDIRSSLFYKENREKSVIFYSGDKGIPILPGLYTCLENKLTMRYRKTILAGFYLRVTDNNSLEIQDDIHNAKYLFSFLGNANNHLVRQKICQLTSTRSYLRDSSKDTRQQDDGVNGANKERGILYRDIMAQSKFILCPRGIGVSSWRLFETMRAGRVPVIISDDWIPPIGPQWDSFSLFVKENDVGKIPKLLQEKEILAGQLGAIARKEWEAWYSKEVVFTTVIDLLLLAHSNIATENSFLHALTYSQYLEPYYLRHWVLSPLKRAIFYR